MASGGGRSAFLVSGRLLQAVGVTLYLCGAGLCFVAVAGAGKAPNLAYAVLAVLGGLAAYGVLRAGHSVFLYGKRLVARGRLLRAGESLSDDARPPVLYLRSFVDDELTSDTPTAFDVSGVHLPRLSTEEEHLARAVADVGPFVAIANPDDSLPRPGATRIEAGPDTWQETVSGLMTRARLVIFRVGDGRFLWWEIEQALETVGRERLIFLIPNDPEVLRTFRERLQPLVSSDVPDLAGEMETSTTVGAILYFGRDGAPRLSPLQSAGYRSSGAQPLRPMLRIALRPVFEQLGLRWTPPPVPLRPVVVMLTSGWGIVLCAYWLTELPPWEIFGGFKLEAFSVFFVCFYLLILFVPLALSLYYFVVGSLALYRAATQFRTEPSE